MSKARVVILLLLFLAPWLFLLAAGGYYLYYLPHAPEMWWVRWTWVPMFVSIGLSYLLAWHWTRRAAGLPGTEIPPQNYWTERDKLAWEKVQAKAAAFDKVTTEQLADPKHYTDLALDLAVQVAEVYNAGSVSGPTTAFDQVTLPEVMTCIELAASDLNELVQKYVPGSHLLRIKDIRRARQAKEWYKVGQNVYWAGAALVNPIDTAMRFFASRSVLGNLFDKLQSNVILWFHTAFVHQLGHYLVELNSGRLRVGVKRYRELLATSKEPPAVESTQPNARPQDSDAATAPSDLAHPIKIVVLGAVKAGKSSLVNALFGQQQATVDALPVTHVGTRYHMTWPGGQSVNVLDTSGYGQNGPEEDERDAAIEAAQDADLIVLVTPATSPGRRNDLAMLNELRGFFTVHPQLKSPPIVVAVTQIDLLSPKTEWNPPYNWRTGSRNKEVNIRECVAAVREQLGSHVVEVVPVCTRSGDIAGVNDDLIPAIAAHLDEARGSSMLRAFQSEATADQIKRIGSQVVEGAKKAWDILKQNLNK